MTINTAHSGFITEQIIALWNKQVRKGRLGLNHQVFFFFSPSTEWKTDSAAELG